MFLTLLTKIIPTFFSVSCNNLGHMESLLKNEEKEKKNSFFYGRGITRVVAALADAFLTTLLGVLLTVLPFYFAFGYYEDVGMYSLHQNNLNAKAIDSHLVAKTGNGSFKSDEDLAYEYVVVQAKKDFYDCDGMRNDRIAYYYLDYKGESVLFLNDLIFEAQGQETLFETSNSETDVATLREEVCSSVLAYTSGRSSNKESFHKVESVFEKLYEEAKEDFSSEPSYMNEFEKMNQIYETMEWKGSLSAFLGYLVSGAFFYVLLPVFAFKGNTIGKKILKLSVLDEYGCPLPKWKLALRGILVFVTELYIPLIIAYVSNWGITSLNLPIFSIGSFAFTLGVFALIFLMLSLASLITLLIRKDKRSFHDLTLRSFVYISDPKRIEEEKRIQEYRLKNQISGEENGSRL